MLTLNNNFKIYQDKSLSFGSVQDKNKEISKIFKTSYESGKMRNFIDYMDTKLPPLPGDKFSASKAKVDKTGHIQIKHSGFGKLFPTKLSLFFKLLAAKVKKLKFKLRLKDLKEVISDTKTIGGGIKGLDPAPQTSWEKTSLKSGWPPSLKHNVSKKVDTDTGAIIFENQRNPDYKIKTYGMAYVDPNNNSVIWAYNHKNQNPDLNWAAWTIAPFKAPKGKKSMGMYPVSENFGEKYQKNLQGNNQWKLDKENNIVFSEPRENGGFFDPFDDKTNWYAYGVEGADEVIVMRTVYKEPYKDKSKACIVDSGKNYVEKEFIAPQVGKDQESTIACRIDFVPLKEMGLTRFESSEMESQLKKVNGYLNKNLKTENI